MAELGARKHVLIFPFPALGHMIPLLDLTHKFASLNLTITILITPKNLHLLNNLLLNHPSINTLVLPFPNHPLISLGIENAKDSTPSCFGPLIHALGQLRDPLFNWFKSHPSPPVAIISDFFLGWTHHLAEELGIPRLVFSPSGAMCLAVLFSLWSDTPKNSSGNQYQEVSFSRIPNCPKYPWWQLSNIYRSYTEGESVSEFIRAGFLADKVSWGIVVNSFEELEGVYLDYLRRELGHNRVWATGPILPTVNDPARLTERGGSSSVPSGELMTWLDRCGDDTVVYVCFGSQVVLTNAQMESMALGLEKSGTRFVWCIKEPTESHVDGEYGKIPLGFEDGVAGRGLVIRGWAPQVSILNHRAVGVFVTHCGWNSVLEGVLAGVVMLAWPMGADQFIDATLLVDELKVAKRICQGSHNIPDPDKLAKLISESVSERLSVGVKRTAELRQAALDAVKDGGSSVTEFNDLVKHLCSLP